MKANKKNALIIAYNGLGNSGVPSVIYNTILSLNDSYNFDVVVFSSDFFYKEILNKKGININIYPISEPKQNTILKKILWILFKKKRYYHHCMVNILEQKQYDVVHSFREYNSYPFFEAALKKGIQKRIFHCNIDYKRKGTKKGKIIVKFWKRKSINLSTDLVAVSKLCGENAFGKRTYSVIYNTYDEDKYRYCDSALPKTSLVLTQIGSFSKNKNQLFSLEILQELLTINNNRFDIKLNLVGNDNNSYGSLIKKTINKYGLGEYVDIYDGNSKTHDILSNSSLTLLPSYSEGASIVAVESQACGIKVYASSSVPKDIDCGNVTFLSLKSRPAFWAKKIYGDFVAYPNKNTIVDLTSFSSKEFKSNMLKLYQNNL